MIKKILLTCITISSLAVVSAQTFVNRGAPVAVMQGGLMIVKTDGVTTGSGSLENDAQGTGIFKNQGDLTIEGSFINTSGVADGYASNTGIYRVLQNWVNNATFTADNSLVELNGGAQQITGSIPTTFFNLNCNTPGSVKTQTLDAMVNGVLTLNGTELATQDNLMTINNTDPAAIVQNNVNTAFVSSDGPARTGRLVRATNQKVDYIFPTGMNDGGTPKIREVAITPANSQSRFYRVRFVDHVPTTSTTTDDGFDTIKKSAGVRAVNDVFYHMIASTDNSPADLSIYFDPTADHRWQGIARWQDVPEWQNLLGAVENPGQLGTSRLRLTKAAWIPTTDEAHALIDTIPIKKDFNFPTAFVGDGNFSGDQSQNAYFTIINQGDLAILDELSVFNRWGEMVFNSKRDATDKWDGHYHGKLQQQGNYVYLATVRNKTTNKLYPTVTGNVSLLW